MRSWIDDDALEPSRALGDRLWMLEPGGNPWFPIEVARRSRALLPEAHILEVENGALSRPDIAVDFGARVDAPRARASPKRERAAPIRDPS